MIISLKTIIRVMPALCAVFCSVCLATPGTYTVTGTLEFKHIDSTGLNDIGASSTDGKVPFPINTRIDLVKFQSDKWDFVEKLGMTTNGSSGSYSITATVEPDTEYKLKVYAETLKDLANTKQRTNVEGYCPGLHDW